MSVYITTRVGIIAREFTDSNSQDAYGQSERLIKRFLEGNRFQPDFHAEARKDFYRDIRCGLLHQAEAKNVANPTFDVR